MNKLAQLIAEGSISVEELAAAQNLIERAKLVVNGLEACKKNLVFPFGVSTIDCYSYTDSAGEYHAWGKVTNDGTFICYCNWGGDHEAGRCNLNDFSDVFLSFDKGDLSFNIQEFLEQQIEKATEHKSCGAAFTA